MTANTKTGQELLTGLGGFLDDDWTGTTTALGTSTTLVDTAQTDFGARAMIDGWISLTSGTYSGETRRVTANDGETTITVSPPFSGAVASGVTYEFHRWDPDAKLDALDKARFIGFPHITRIVEDETVMTDGHNRRFGLSSDLATGPYTAWREQYLDPDPNWNFLQSPKGDSLTGWTASAGSAALYAKSDYDRTVPKYDDNCTKLTIPVDTAVSYQQVVGDMTFITAAIAAGRQVTFGAWAYARTASRVTVKVTDDAGSSSSTAHSGRGWQYLEVEHDVDGDNATTLTVSIEVSSGAVMTVFWNRAWFTLGEVPDIYNVQVPGIRVQRDGSSQTVFLPEVLPERFQLRLVGRGHLSALNGSRTATMEVDDGMAELLYAYAARVLLREAGMSSEDTGPLSGKIASTMQTISDTKSYFDAEPANDRGIKSPYFSGG